MSKFVLDNLNNTFESYDQLIRLYNENKTYSRDVIGISLTNWFAANMSSALGGVLDLLQSRFNVIKFQNIPDKVKTILQKNDFLSHFGYQRFPDWYGTTITYQKLTPNDGRYFLEYLKDDLLNRSELPKMTPTLKKKIMESIFELFVNAQIHSETKFIYTCGQFYPQKNKIEFTITDTGIGFKNKVNKRFGKNLSSIDAIKWATTHGHSTKIGISGGIGLTILKEFIHRNKGKIQIISDDGFYEFHVNSESAKTFTHSFPGSIINLEFRTDDAASYELKSDTSLDDLF